MVLEGLEAQTYNNQNKYKKMQGILLITHPSHLKPDIRNLIPVKKKPSTTSLPAKAGSDASRAKNL